MGGEDCTCEEQCPDEDECMCVYIYDEDRCIAKCGHIFHVEEKTLAAEASIALRARKVELTVLGEFLGALSADDVLIPAARARERVTLDRDYTTLNAALEETGLVLRRRVPPPSLPDEA